MKGGKRSKVVHRQKNRDEPKQSRDRMCPRIIAHSAVSLVPTLLANPLADVEQPAPSVLESHPTAFGWSPMDSRFFFVAFVSQLWILKLARKPPMYSDALARMFVGVLPVALLLHLTVTCYMLGNANILNIGFVR